MQGITTIILVKAYISFYTIYSNSHIRLLQVLRKVIVTVKLDKKHPCSNCGHAVFDPELREYYCQYLHRKQDGPHADHTVTELKYCLVT